MRLNKIKSSTKYLLEGGLNKKQYNEILDGLELGVELELTEGLDISLTQAMIDSGSYKVDLEVDIYNFFDNHGFINSIDRFNSDLEHINSDEKLLNFIDNHGTPYDKPEEIDVMNILDYSYIDGNYTEVEDTLTKAVESLKTVVRDAEKFLYEIYSHAGSGFDSYHYLRDSINQLNNISEILENKFNEEYIQEYIDNEEMIALEEYKPTTEQVNDYIKSECSGAIQDIENLAIKEKFIYAWDSSVNYPGIELVTPVLKYEDFLIAIPNLVESLADAGFGGDVSCGYHIGISSDKINIKQLIEESYQKYQDRGYSKFASAMATLQQGYLNIFKYHNPERVAYAEEYAKNLITYLKSEGVALDTFDEHELMYGSNSNLDYYVGKFFKEKYVDTNTKHEGYVELRTLGGEEGFEILRDTSKLKLFLYDAISQVFGGFKELSAKEIAKLVNIHRREDLKAEPFTSNRMAKIKRKTAELRNKQEEQ